MYYIIRQDNRSEIIAQSPRIFSLRDKWMELRLLNRSIQYLLINESEKIIIKSNQDKHVAGVSKL